MSIEFKMNRHGRNRKSRLHKKTTRAALNKIDALHLPMRVHTGKNGYWGETSTESAFMPYRKLTKFLMSRVGKPIDKVFSEFLVEAKKYKHNEKLKEMFYSHLDYEKNKMRIGIAEGFYVSNGILNYKDDWSQEKKSEIPWRFIKYNKEHWEDNFIDTSKAMHTKGPVLLNKLWVEVKGQYMFLPVYIIKEGKLKEMGDSSEFVKAYIVGKGYWFTTTYISNNPLIFASFCYYYFTVRILDIENYKKEKFKKTI